MIQCLSVQRREYQIVFFIMILGYFNVSKFSNVLKKKIILRFIFTKIILLIKFCSILDSADEPEA